MTPGAGTDAWGASRLATTFARLRADHRPGLVTFTAAGDPSLERSADVLRALDEAGADVLEVGVPFTDPLADGPDIQRASERALAAGATLSSVLELVAATRAVVRAPLVLFTYANPILRMGLDRFAGRAADAGIDGVLVVDLPIEEAGALHDVLTRRALDPIFLLSPTTTETRLRQAVAIGRGFLYGISRLGVTGMRDRVTGDARVLVERVRALTPLPIAVGFGLSRPEHVAEVCTFADAAVVGSAIVRVVAEWGGSNDLPNRVRDYVRWLKGGQAPDPLRGAVGR
jgi:tryptophan synthase alpha chain